MLECFARFGSALSSYSDLFRSGRQFVFEFQKLELVKSQFWNTLFMLIVRFSGLTVVLFIIIAFFSTSLRAMPKLYFRHGAVSSAKTLNLLAVAHNYKTQGKNVVLMKVWYYPHLSFYYCVLIVLCFVACSRCPMGRRICYFKSRLITNCRLSYSSRHKHSFTSCS